MSADETDSRLLRALRWFVIVWDCLLVGFGFGYYVGFSAGGPTSGGGGGSLPLLALLAHPAVLTFLMAVPTIPVAALEMRAKVRKSQQWRKSHQGDAAR
ncbi:MAG: hypothetical protein V3T53_15240 [Phycisphaerales bacterium]